MIAAQAGHFEARQKQFGISCSVVRLFLRPEATEVRPLTHPPGTIAAGPVPTGRRGRFEGIGQLAQEASLPSPLTAFVSGIREAERPVRALNERATTGLRIVRGILDAGG